MVSKKNLEIIFPENSKKYVSGPICISGPPGIGKTTIGRKIAEKIGVTFYDIDEIIATKAGVKTTKEVIEKRGFPFFWKVENFCLNKHFQKKGRYVLAFGGTICSPDNPHLKENQSLTRKNAFTICLLPSKDLDESTKILWSRQHNNKRFTVESSKKLQIWIKNRMPGYIESADRIIYTYHAPIEKIVSAILEILKQ